MRDLGNRSESDRPAAPDPTSGHPDTDGQSDLDGIVRLLGALESAVSAIRERVSRLETDVRNLQGQIANRS